MTDNPAVAPKAAALFEQSYHELAVRNDRLFARLFVVEWVAAMLLAVWLTPLTYAGTHASIHMHLYAAVFLGLATISVPIFLTRFMPGAAVTRHAVAAAQMVMCGLLIDLTGGRIETHFLIFGTLAFLAFYRDWRILVTASAVTAADHLLGAILSPRTMYGVDTVGAWRWLEHAGYVILEDVFLIASCRFGLRERQAVSARQAELECAESELQATQQDLERRVADRTSALIAANEATEQTERLLSSVLTCSLDGVMAFKSVRDEQGKIINFRWLLANPAAERIVGKTHAELMGHLLLDMFPGKEPKGFFAGYVNVVETGEPMHLEQYYGRDGVDTYLEISAVKLGDGFSVTFADVSARKLTEAALRESESESRLLAEDRSRIAERLAESERFARSTVDALSAHIAILDETGVILAVNQAWNSFGSANSSGPGDRATGANYLQACATARGEGAADARAMADGIRGVIRGDELEFSLEYACHAPHERRWYVGRVTRFPGDGPVRVVISHVNITARRIAEDQLKAAKEVAEAATRAKSEFLANMSHEIRTPVTAMVGFADMMLDPGQTQSDRLDGLQTIRRNAKHLLDVINEILDLSKIEAGRMTVENIPTELPPLLSDVLSIMRPRALEKGLDLNLRFADKVPKTVFTDPVRAKQILMNLVGNALKFTEKGRVEIQVSPVPGEGALKFDVVDSGIGISQEQIDKLFQPFVQADGSTTRRFGGTGLGLTISKHLAQMLGGDITVRSTVGLGSIFSAQITGAGDGTGECCRVEDALVVPQAGPTVIATTISGRILLAEDGKDNQRFISAMLRKTGAEVVIADNGRIAVEMALGQKFDLILMDMQMPELDGYAATSRLRSKGYTGPIVALTAHAMADDRAKCIKAGCTDYLVKPIDRKHLVEMSSKYVKVGRSVVEQAPAPIPASAGPSGQIVSTCENDPVMAEVLPEFIANLSNEVSSLRSLLAGNDLDQLQDTVHQIKGAGGSYGFACLSDAAAIAELSLKSGADLETVKSQVDSLVELIQKVRGYQPTPEPARG